ncbi:MAG: hypothetical protein RPR97_13975 [Colwellia sp.]|jgi:hypothetical protein
MSDFEKSITSDPSVSFWLKEQIKITKNRDLMDALNDVEVLKSVLDDRLSGAIRVSKDILQPNTQLQLYPE